MNETNKSTLTITPQGENLNEIVEWIKTMQVRGMKFPPKKDNYYVNPKWKLIVKKKSLFPSNDWECAYNLD